VAVARTFVCGMSSPVLRQICDLNLRQAILSVPSDFSPLHQMSCYCTGKQPRRWLLRKMYGLVFACFTV
jgi:hypothetical protein